MCTEVVLDPWRETVRDIYDDLHFGEDNLFTGSRLAKRLVDFLERRHPGFFDEQFPREEERKMADFVSQVHVHPTLELALRLAHDAGGDVDRVIRRAEAYHAFLNQPVVSARDRLDEEIGRKLSMSSALSGELWRE